MIVYLTMGVVVAFIYVYSYPELDIICEIHFFIVTLAAIVLLWPLFLIMGIWEK